MRHGSQSGRRPHASSVTRFRVAAGNAALLAARETDQLGRQGRGQFRTHSPPMTTSGFSVLAHDGERGTRDVVSSELADRDEHSGRRGARRDDDYLCARIALQLGVAEPESTPTESKLHLVRTRPVKREELERQLDNLRRLLVPKAPRDLAADVQHHGCSNGDLRYERDR